MNAPTNAPAKTIRYFELMLANVDKADEAAANCAVLLRQAKDFGLEGLADRIAAEMHDYENEAENLRTVLITNGYVPE